MFGLLKTWMVRLLIAGCFLPVPVFAASLVTVNAAPWAVASEGQTSGMIVDLAQALTARTGIALTPRALPAPRIPLMVNSGEVELAFLSAANPMEATALGTLFELPVIAIARPGVSLARYEDLVGLRIGIVGGLNLNTRLEADPALNRLPEPNYAQILRKMEAGRLDATIGAEPTLRATAREIGPGFAFGDKIVLQTAPVLLHASRKGLAPEVQTRIAEGFAALHRDGTIEKIRGKYFNPDWSLK